jgi:aspartate/methionine/tyrosine aminotransferase
VTAPRENARVTAPRQIAGSPYMEWSKLRSPARFNLATSGLSNFPLSALPVRIEDLEINGPTIYGYAPLQERLAARTGAPAESIVAAAGTSMANHLALAALVEPGDDVLVEHPAYELLLSTAAYLGASVRRFARRAGEGFRLDPAEVERSIAPGTRLVVVTNFHNPTSVRADDAALAEIGAIAARAGARVLVDEVYLECLDRPRSAFFLGDNFVTTASLTKAYGLSGLRCGWVIAPPELARRMWRINDLYGATPAHPAELLSVVALDNLDSVAARTRAHLARNRALLDRFLDSRRDLEVVRTESGTTSFPRLPPGRVDELCRLLREKYETSVVPGSFFEMPEHFRIGIGGETAMVAEGLERLGLALDELSTSVP